MKIIYNGPHDAVVLANVTCKRGEAVEFPEPIAQSAVQQDVWITKSTKEDN